MELLQTATADLGGSLQLVAAPLEDYALPAGAFSLQHVAVQYSMFSNLVI